MCAVYSSQILQNDNMTEARVVPATAIFLRARRQQLARSIIITRVDRIRSAAAAAASDNHKICDGRAQPCASRSCWHDVKSSSVIIIQCENNLRVSSSNGSCYAETRQFARVPNRSCSTPPHSRDLQRDGRPASSSTRASCPRATRICRRRDRPVFAVFIAGDGVQIAAAAVCDSRFMCSPATAITTGTPQSIILSAVQQLLGSSSQIIL